MEGCSFMLSFFYTIIEPQKSILRGGMFKDWGLNFKFQISDWGEGREVLDFGFQIWGLRWLIWGVFLGYSIEGEKSMGEELKGMGFLF